MLKLPKIIYIFLALYLGTFIYVDGLLGVPHPELFYTYSLIPAELNLALEQGEAFKLVTLISYSVLHSGFTHAALNSLWFLVFGTAIAREMSAPRFILFCSLVSVFPGLVYFLMNMHSTLPMIGASGTVCGLMGASLYVMPYRSWQLTSEPIRTRNYSQALKDLFRRQQSKQFIVLFHIINLAMALQPAVFGADGSIAWEAHIAGFWAGILLMPLFRGAR